MNDNTKPDIHPDPTPEEYLFALMKIAPWVDESYRQVVAKHKKPEVLRELYLCASEGVPIESVKEALRKRPPEGTLRAARHKMIIDKTLGDSYSQDIISVKEVTDSVKDDVKQLSNTIQMLTGILPNLEAITIPEPVEATEDITRSPASAADENNTKPDIHPESDKEKKVQPQRFNVLDLFRARHTGPARLVSGLIESEFNETQIKYILDCYEEGVSEEIIKKIAIKNLPVDVMQRLRNMYESEEKNHGKR